MAYNILIADDESEILELLQLYLEQDYNVFEARNGLEAMSIVIHQKIDLAILDIMMPDMDGLKLIKRIREAYYMPIIFLSAKSQHHDKILGLELGADDYITKPFNPLEIVARVQALLRRVHHFDANVPKPKEDERLTVGDLIYDRTKGSVYRGDQEIILTPTEYKILGLLMSQPGKVFTRKKIYETVWGDYYTYEDSAIMVHISNLREKIEENTRHPVYIKTIRGLGYKIEVPAEV